MKDIYDEIEQFFRTQRELYGKDLLLDGELQSGRAVRKEEKVTATASEKTETSQSPLRQFYHEIKNCMNCPLGSLRTHFVFGAGNDNADLLLVGEAPGRDEDLQGIPFVGRAGQLLNLMLKAIQLRREDVFIAGLLHP